MFASFTSREAYQFFKELWTTGLDSNQLRQVLRTRSSFTSESGRW
jgi:hypothetical protein